LFNDDLIYATIIQNTEEKRYKDAKEKDLSSLSCVGEEKDTFFLLTDIRNPDNYLRVEVESPEDRTLWVQKFTSAIKESKLFAKRKLDHKDPSLTGSKPNSDQSSNEKVSADVSLPLSKSAAELNSIPSTPPLTSSGWKVVSRKEIAPLNGPVIRRGKSVGDIEESVESGKEMDNSETDSSSIPVESEIVPTHLDVEISRQSLWEAIQEGDLQKTKTAIHAVKVTDLNTANEKGQTVLAYAVAEGNTEIVKEILLVKGIELNAQDKDGNTALHLASINNKPGILSLLLSSGTDVDIQNHELKTAYATAASGVYPVWALWTKGGMELLAQNGYPTCSVPLKSETSKKIKREEKEGSSQEKKGKLKYEISNTGEHISPLEEVVMDPKWDNIRDKVAAEIMTTEYTYVKGVQISLLLFGEPIQAAFENGDLPAELEVLKKKFSWLWHKYYKQTSNFYRACKKDSRTGVILKNLGMLCTAWPHGYGCTKDT